MNIRFLPLILIGGSLLTAYLSGFACFLTFDHFYDIHQLATQYTQIHPIMGPLAFILIYALYVSLALPGIFLLTILAGVLFTQPFSTFYVIAAETIGGSILFLSARLASTDFFYRKSGRFLDRMEKQFQENAISYLFFLRINPLLPLWIVNIAPALFGIQYFTFFWTTVIGAAPGSFVFTQIGASLVHILKSHEQFNSSLLFNTKSTIAISSLILLALLPLLIKKRMNKT